MRERSAYPWWGLAEMQKLPSQHLACFCGVNSACYHARPHQEHLGGRRLHL